MHECAHAVSCIARKKWFVKDSVWQERIHKYAHPLVCSPRRECCGNQPIRQSVFAASILEHNQLGSLRNCWACQAWLAELAFLFGHPLFQHSTLR